MDGSLYSCEMRFDPDHASVRHASTEAAAVSIHYVYIRIDERGSLVAQQKWTCPFREVCFILLFFPLSFPRSCEIISHVLQ